MQDNITSFPRSPLITSRRVGRRLLVSPGTLWFLLALAFVWGAALGYLV